MAARKLSIGNSRNFWWVLHEKSPHTRTLNYNSRMFTPSNKTSPLVTSPVWISSIAAERVDLPVPFGPGLIAAIHLFSRVRLTFANFFSFNLNVKIFDLNTDMVVLSFSKPLQVLTRNLLDFLENAKYSMKIKEQTRIATGLLLSTARRSWRFEFDFWKNIKTNKYTFIV